MLIKSIRNQYLLKSSSLFDFNFINIKINGALKKRDEKLLFKVKDVDWGKLQKKKVYDSLNIRNYSLYLCYIRSIVNSHDAGNEPRWSQYTSEFHKFHFFHWITGESETTHIFIIISLQSIYSSAIQHKYFQTFLSDTHSSMKKNSWTGINYTPSTRLHTSHYKDIDCSFLSHLHKFLARSSTFSFVQVSKTNRGTSVS